ncbi:hypothetical protein HN873_066780 [Arachis hypogaea]
MANPGVLFCLEEALHSLEISLNQIICYTWFGSDTLKLKSIRAGLRKLNLVEDRAIARSPVKIVPTSMAKEFAGVNV